MAPLVPVQEIRPFNEDVGIGFLVNAKIQDPFHDGHIKNICAVQAGRAVERAECRFRLAGVTD